VAARVAALEADLLDWQTLAKAFGRDGLPVLEIDAAGPTISAYTNDLLATCYGPRFTVDVVTQQAKADGKGLKETFTIAVLDNAAGAAVRDIADLSGGEQVIVAEALANAIAIYVNTRSPQPVRTCWRDETTGALDPENAARYLAMLRQVQTLGGFHHVLFITHNPDAAAQADAQIRLADGHVTIAQPPYGETVAA
jgi:exonuclease SbcC